MQKVKQRVWSILLVCMMLLTMFPAAVSAEGGALPEAVDGVITLTENVDISASGYTVTGDITLDLNGFELKAANTGTGSIKSPGRCEAYAERQLG